MQKLGWAVKPPLSQTRVPPCRIILEIRSEDIYKVPCLVSTVKEVFFIMAKGALRFSLTLPTGERVVVPVGCANY